MIRRVRMSLLLLCLTLFGFTAGAAEPPKKILYIDSYHPDYLWSHDILAGIRGVLDSHNDIELSVFYLDTKRNKDEKFIQSVARQARQLIDSWHPDVVISADDNAAKYVVAPLYKDHPLPFVFCGLNWDAEAYGFPAENVTGMVEVCLVTELIETLSRFSTGSKVGYLASNTLSERKELENINKRFQLDFDERLVENFSQLKEAFLELQQNNDLILIQECRSVEGFDHEEMIAFVKNNTQVPTGAMQKYLVHYALVAFAKVGEEQGEFAARTALRILNGAEPSSIPVAENKRARIFLNTEIAHQLKIKFPIDLLEVSTFVNEGLFK